jgi:uncharacterized membrane protein YhaH (DUF805 family)
VTFGYLWTLYVHVCGINDYEHTCDEYLVLLAKSGMIEVWIAMWVEWWVDPKRPTCILIYGMHFIIIPVTYGVPTISVLTLFYPPSSMLFRRWWRCGVPWWGVLLAGVPIARLPVVLLSFLERVMFSLYVIRGYSCNNVFYHDIGFI